MSLGRKQILYFCFILLMSFNLSLFISSKFPILSSYQASLLNNHPRIELSHFQKGKILSSAGETSLFTGVQISSAPPVLSIKKDEQKWPVMYSSFRGGLQAWPLKLFCKTLGEGPGQFLYLLIFKSLFLGLLGFLVLKNSSSKVAAVTLGILVLSPHWSVIGILNSDPLIQGCLFLAIGILMQEKMSPKKLVILSVLLALGVHIHLNFLAFFPLLFLWGRKSLEIKDWEGLGVYLGLLLLPQFMLFEVSDLFTREFWSRDISFISKLSQLLIFDPGFLDDFLSVPLKKTPSFLLGGGWLLLGAYLFSALKKSKVSKSELFEILIGCGLCCLITLVLTKEDDFLFSELLFLIVPLCWLLAKNLRNIFAAIFLIFFFWGSGSWYYHYSVEGPPYLLQKKGVKDLADYLLKLGISRPVVVDSHLENKLEYLSNGRIAPLYGRGYINEAKLFNHAHLIKQMGQGSLVLDLENNEPRFYKGFDNSSKQPEILKRMVEVNGGIDLTDYYLLQGEKPVVMILNFELKEEVQPQSLAPSDSPK